MPGRKPLGLDLQFTAGRDPQPLHLGRRRRPHPVELGYRQGLDKGLPLVGWIANCPFGLRRPDASLARNLL